MSINIKYTFGLSESRQEQFLLQFGEERCELLSVDMNNQPDWATLKFMQCPHCPLDENTSPLCPLAASISAPALKFDGILSFEEVRLQVETPERTIIGKVTTQSALSSLTGLLIATSGCPHTEFLRPMARYHLPMATTDETTYRAVSMYLLAQYFMRQGGQNIEDGLDGLNHLYRQIHKVNTHIAKRLNAALSTDSSTNAIVRLDMFTLSIPMSVEESLDELRDLFFSYTST